MKHFIITCLQLPLILVGMLISVYDHAKSLYPLASPCFLASFVLHLLFFIACYFQFSSAITKPSINSKEKVIVSTYQLKATPLPKVKPLPNPKVNTQKAKLKRKSVSTPSKNQSKLKPNNNEKITKKAAPTPPITTPAPSTPSFNNLEKISPEEDYHRQLVTLLQAYLHLPKQGGVKLHLTLDRSGAVINIEILKSSHQENLHYIQKQLNRLKFPSFGVSFFGQQNHTFVLSLQNDAIS